MEQVKSVVSSWSKAEQTAFKLIGAVLFALLTILSAEIRIPLWFTPVPMTLQTFVVPLAGGFLGAAFGAGSMLLYLALGIFGFSAFAAASGGFVFFVSPTIGYLLSYPIVAMVMGRFRKSSAPVLLLTLVLTNVFTFFCGMIGLMANAHMTIAESFARGVAPFLIGDVLKIAASFFVLVCYRSLRK